MTPAPSSRALDRVGRDQYGHRISFKNPNASTESNPVSGILRQIWRENYENSVPGRCVAIIDDITSELCVFGPLPLAFVITDHGPVDAPAPSAESPTQRPSWVPSRIGTITVRWWGGPKDNTEQDITPERMRRRFVSSSTHRTEKAEYVWNEKFVPDGNRHFTADFWFAGWVTADETKVSTSDKPSQPMAAGDRYRVQFCNGPFVEVLDHFEVSENGRPKQMIVLTTQMTGRAIPVTYSYTGFGAGSPAGARCSYSVVKP